MSTQLVDDFEQFFKNYYDGEIKQLAQNYPQESRSLFVDWMDLYRYDPDLADDFITDPEQLQRYAEEALRIYDLPIDVSLGNAHVRVHNLPDGNTYNIGEFSPSRKDGELLSLSGQVAKKTKVEPIPVEIAYECQLCGTLNRVDQTGESFKEPHECKSCERQGPFREISKHSTKEDYQQIRLTQPPEQTNGEDGQFMDVRIRDDIVDCVDGGDRVDFVGEFTLERPPSNTDKETYDMAVDGMAADVKQSDYEEIEITPEIEEKIHAVARGEYGNPFELLVNSLAPKLKGLDGLKEGLILSLFGGVRVKHDDGTAERGDIHVLMIGDPGTAKTTLLEAIGELAPRSVRASGRGATVSGMTAAAVQDDFGDGNWSLEAGALVIGHKGVATVDEIDKLSEGVEEAMHDAMASQKVSVNKAGINTTLPSQTTVVAAGNPKYGRFDQHEPIGQQIAIGPTLLTRFDLMYTLTDKPDEDRDRMIAQSKIKSKETAKRESGDGGSTLAIAKALEDIRDEDDALELMRAYIAYARRNIDPVIEDEEVAEKIEDTYVELRLSNDDDEGPVPVSARKLDGFQRLAEASARVRLSETIEMHDVERAKEHVESTLEDVGIDPETGDYDADIVEAGTSKSQRDRIKTLKQLIEDIEEEYDEGAPIDIVEERADIVGVSEHKLDHEIDKLMQKGEVYEPSTDTLRTT